MPMSLLWKLFRNIYEGFEENFKNWGDDKILKCDTGHEMFKI